MKSNEEIITLEKVFIPLIHRTYCLPKWKISLAIKLRQRGYKVTTIAWFFGVCPHLIYDWTKGYDYKPLTYHTE